MGEIRSQPKAEEISMLMNTRLEGLPDGFKDKQVPGGGGAVHGTLFSAG